MSHELNPSEVLYYLNELGYTNISAKQLKEFMIDLKKLLKQKGTDVGGGDETNDYPCQVKHNKQFINENQRAYNYRNAGKHPNDETFDESSNYTRRGGYTGGNVRASCRSYDENACCKSYDGEDEESYESRQSDSDGEETQRVPTRDVFDELYNTETISSRAKVKRKNERVITVQIHRPKCVAKTNTEVGTDTVDLVSPRKVVSQCRQSPVASTVTEPLKGTTCSTARTTHSGTSGKKGSGSSVEKKGRMRPKTSFIRPRLNTKPPKSDPVALYHQYQEEWKKHKIPGTENHSQVRWCIREKLLGDKFDYCY